MSSEEMRIELERFVNTGLQEGWTGWPLKVGACVTCRLAGQWSVAPASAWLCHHDGRVCPVGMENMFASLHSLC
jgi:hypothetical protein